MTRSGDRCDCGGTFGTYRTIPKGRRRTRYLKCNDCGTTAKEVVNIDANGRVELSLPDVVNGPILCEVCRCKIHTSPTTADQ